MNILLNRYEEGKIADSLGRRKPSQYRHEAARSDYKPKYSEVSREEALGNVIEVKKELHGAV